jgi:hypothetical protein
MKKRLLLIAGILMLAIVMLVPSCRKEVYTDEDALAAMKEGLKYKNDLEKELMTLQLTNQLQMLGLEAQLTMKERRFADSLDKVGAKVTVSIQVQDVTGNTTDMSGFTVTSNQMGIAKTLTTDANGFVLFPDCVSGTASFVVTKAGFARAAGILLLGEVYENSQQAVVIPVFPTTAATSKISGVLSAQLNLLTEAEEPVKDGILSLSFEDVFDMLQNPNSTFHSLNQLGIAGLVYDGGFMQTVKTGADGKYEFLIPKTKQNISYKLAVSTIQKKQKLLFGDYPNKLDSIRVDSLPVYFGYNSNGEPFQDEVGFSASGNNIPFAGVNIKIDAPTGGQTPTAEANIKWAHHDSTLVTWSYSKFAFGDGWDELTNITQAPVFSYEPYDEDKVVVETPTAGVVNIVNGKVVSLNMTNGGLYKEYGRNWYYGLLYPTQASTPVFKFFEQLAIEEPSTYKVAQATGSIVLEDGKVKVVFNFTEPGRGYTAIPNVRFRLHTPNTADSVLTNSNLKVNLLPDGAISIDPVVLDDYYTSTTDFWVLEQPRIGTFKRNGEIKNGNYYISTNPSITYKVDLLNGFKIMDGGLGYKTAPKVLVKNYVRKQNTTGSFEYLTVAEATTTIDASGRIISVSDPVMLDNFEFERDWYGDHYSFYSDNEVSAPVDVLGLANAHARAIVDENGTISQVLLYNESYDTGWRLPFWANYYSGKGYTTTPNVKVTPVGKTTVAKQAILKAQVGPDGRIYNILIVDGGRGYDVVNNDNAMNYPDDLSNYITTNGSSDFVYNINMGSGWHGPASEIFY